MNRNLLRTKAKAPRNDMTLSDFIKLIRHYVKLVILLPVLCAIFAVVFILVNPQTYLAKASLLTNGDIALAGGFAQNEAELFSQNGVKVTAKTDTTYRTITIEAEGSDYDACIEAANATVLAAGEDYHEANEEASISTNEATSAEDISPNIVKMAFMALLVGLFFAICFVVVIDMLRTPIKSKSDIESVSGLPVIGVIPNLDRGERLIANIRFIGEKTPSSIAVIPIGYTGAALTCAELASAFEYSGVAVSRISGNPHAEGFSHATIPGMVAIVECAPLSEGMGAVYIAKDTDITILCVSEWRDSRKALAAVMEELRFARAELGGVVFLTSGYSDKML